MYRSRLIRSVECSPFTGVTAVAGIMGIAGRRTAPAAGAFGGGQRSQTEEEAEGEQEFESHNDKFLILLVDAAGAPDVTYKILFI